MNWKNLNNKISTPTPKKSNKESKYSPAYSERDHNRSILIRSSLDSSSSPSKIFSKSKISVRRAKSNSGFLEERIQIMKSKMGALINELRVIFVDIKKMVKETNKCLEEISEKFNVIFKVEMSGYEKIEDKMQKIKNRLNSEFSYESKYKEDKKMIMSNVMVKPNTSKACELGRKSENKKPRNFEALNVKEIKSKDKSVSNSFIGMKTTIETMKKLLKQP